MDAHIEMAFIGYESLLDMFSYKIHVTNLFANDDLKTIEAFLDQHSFDDYSITFDEFRYQYQIFKCAFEKNPLPFDFF